MSEIIGAMVLAVLFGIAGIVLIVKGMVFVFELEARHGSNAVGISIIVWAVVMTGVIFWALEAAKSSAGKP